jgi:hypothetical protein
VEDAEHPRDELPVGSPVVRDRDEIGDQQIVHSCHVRSGDVDDRGILSTGDIVGFTLSHSRAHFLITELVPRTTFFGDG